MRTVATGLVLIMVVTLGLSGCATIEENPKTAVGTGVGAAGGALLGGLIGRSTTGVVVGGLLGALAGGAIGHYMDRQDRTAAQATAQTGYQPSQGTLVRVEAVQVEPATISPGGTVNLGATYSVLSRHCHVRRSLRPATRGPRLPVRAAGAGGERFSGIQLHLALSGRPDLAEDGGGPSTLRPRAAGRRCTAPWP